MPLVELVNSLESVRCAGAYAVFLQYAAEFHATIVLAKVCTGVQSVESEMSLAYVRCVAGLGQFCRPRSVTVERFPSCNTLRTSNLQIMGFDQISALDFTSVISSPQRS